MTKLKSAPEARSEVPVFRSPKTHGPLADLEKHLPNDWWQSLFNSIYLKTDGDVVENEQNTRNEVQMLIEFANLKVENTILDLCCGQGRHTLELYRQGFEKVTGLDRSRYLIRVAKRRAQQLGYLARFCEGDARKFRLPESNFDCVVLFGNSFGYFESQEDDICVLNEVLRVLKSKGKIAMDIVDGDWMRKNFEPRSWEWIDQNHFVCRERSLSQDKSKIISREVVVHAERGVLADQFYAERLYSLSEISGILEDLHFVNIVPHASIQAHSDRGQDLGMMANRLFITAQAPVKIDKRPKVKAQKSITVVMGDPRLSDSVKLNGQFNSEDFTTIEKLKEALGKLEQYEFSYLDDHKKMIELIRRNKPEFVLNLCDEGFNNEALKELHVPAFLEMNNIPYTGAGPACLALCYNKAIVRAVASSVDIPVPLETYYDPSDQSATLPSIFPALLKPNLGDSSIGITKNAVVHNSRQLINYLNHLKETLPNIPILIQEYLAGDEYSVSLVGNPGNYTVLPVLKVDYSGLPQNLPHILGYESKWDPGSPYWNSIRYVEAQLSAELERKLVDYSTILFERLGCRDYARFDFRADEQGEVKLLEANPNPGWCWDGKFNLMAGFGDISYPELLKMVIDAGLERILV